MPRIWFSGPRIVGGLIRPGISFALSELKRKPPRKRANGHCVHEDVPELSAEDAERARLMALPANADTFRQMPLHIQVVSWVIQLLAIHFHGGLCDLDGPRWDLP
jgi:hypothetical protein